MVESWKCSCAVVFSSAAFQSFAIESYVYISQIVNELQEIRNHLQKCFPITCRCVYKNMRIYKEECGGIPTV